MKLVDLAEMLEVAGDREGARAALEQAIELNDEKGNLVAAKQCRDRLARLRGFG